MANFTVFYSLLIHDREKFDMELLAVLMKRAIQMKLNTFSKITISHIWVNLKKMPLKPLPCTDETQNTQLSVSNTVQPNLQLQSNKIQPNPQSAYYKGVDSYRKFHRSQSLKAQLGPRFSKVYCISSDRTPKQRIKHKELVVELKNKIQVDSNKHWKISKGGVIFAEIKDPVPEAIPAKVDITPSNSKEPPPGAPEGGLRARKRRAPSRRRDGRATISDDIASHYTTRIMKAPRLLCHK